jgi:rhamnulokinase
MIAMPQKTVLAVDLGAESGRVMAVHYDGAGLRLEELHRFPNGPIDVRETLYWDFLRLWSEIKIGIEKGKQYHPAGIGVDTWGVDFALLDRDGRLLSNPVHYRDKRTEGIMETVFATVPKEEIFSRTGIQFMRINTLFQIKSMVHAASPVLQAAETFLMAPDLINYWLTGEIANEYTAATTSQMLNARSGSWDTDLLGSLNIPSHLFADVVPPGSKLGAYNGIPVFAPASHDTGSAVAAVPTETADYCFISSGTWSLIGLETQKPYLGVDALAANVTNEGGVFGTYRLLQNATGLWIVQQCRAAWRQQGQDYSYAELVELALSAPPLDAFINVNDPAFLPPGDHPRLVQEYCARTGQRVPQSPGAIIRTILQSLALTYRLTLNKLLAVSGRTAEIIHIVGGGIQNELLNQMAANATGRPVVAGPIEATVIGNALVQLIALGELQDIGEGRQLVANMNAWKCYEPQDTAIWNDAYLRYETLLKGSQ